MVQTDFVEVAKIGEIPSGKMKHTEVNGKEIMIANVNGKYYALTDRCGQLAKAVTGAKIIAMDLDDKKLDVAKKNGADNTINSKKEDPVKAIMELTDKLGADAVIDFVNASKTVETDMQFLRRRARLVLVGLFGGELKLALVTMPTRAYKIIGSYTGTLSDMIELVSLARRGVIKPVVSNHFKLEQATDALTMLKEGKILGRGVINL